MRANLILIAFTLLSWSVNAHNPLSARFDLRLERNMGVLEANFAQAGLHEAVQKYFQDTDFDAISDKAYKELVIVYIKENIDIHLDGKPVRIGAGGIRLGAHQTDLKLSIENVPNSFKKVDVHNTCFQENEYHQTLFYLHHAEKKAKIFLKEKNEFSGEFVLNQQSILTAYTPSYNYQNPLIVFIVLSICSITFLVYRKRADNT